MFEMELQVDESQSYTKLQDHIEYNDDLDDVTSLVMDICGYLDEANLVSFTVIGFKDMEWPVDVRTDLSTIITQVPNAIRSLRNRQQCSIGFFEQGIDRELRFRCERSSVFVDCFSLSGDPISTESEEIQLDELIEMLTDLLGNFVEISKRACPNITGHHLFTGWESAYSAGH